MRGTPLGELMQTLAPEVEEDRQTLIRLMKRLDASKNPFKHAGAWIAEKAMRVKFRGLSSRDREVGELMAIESMTLGVKGKLGLWEALGQVADQHPAIAALDLDALVARARTQYDSLENERLAAAQRALGQSGDEGSRRG